MIAISALLAFSKSPSLAFRGKRGCRWKIRRRKRAEPALSLLNHALVGSHLYLHHLSHWPFSAVFSSLSVQRTCFPANLSALSRFQRRNPSAFSNKEYSREAVKQRTREMKGFSTVNVSFSSRFSKSYPYAFLKNKLFLSPIFPFNPIHII